MTIPANSHKLGNVAKGARSMQTRDKPIGPTDRNIERRTVALGVVGFLLLSGVFFGLAFFCIGPRMRSPVQRLTPSRSAPSYIPPQASDRNYAHRTDEDQPAIHLQVIEREVERASREAEEASGARDREDRRDRVAAREDASASFETLTVPQDAPNIKHPPAELGRRGPPLAQTKVFKVQVGTFVKDYNAATLASDLQGKGFKATVTAVQVEGHRLYRVKLGRFKTREDAQELASDLSAVGYASAIIMEYE